MTIEIKHTNIYEALCAAQANMPNAVLNKTNPHFKSKYADLSSIRDATLPHLNAAGIAVTQPTRITEDGLVVSTILALAADPSQQIVAEWLVPFGTPQAMGSGMTYGRRYTWATACAITAEEDDDANAAMSSPKVRRSVTDVVLGEDTLSKAASRPVYDQLIKEMRVIGDGQELRDWGLENTDRIHVMSDDFQRLFRNDYKKHMTAVGGSGNALLDKLRRSVAEEIDDEIPDTGGGTAA